MTLKMKNRNDSQYKFLGFKQRKEPAAQEIIVSPVLLCSASSVAICIRASSTRALSNHVYQSSSSCRKLAPVASDTFLVASLHSRSMKPGMFSRVTVGEDSLIVHSLLIHSFEMAQNTLYSLFELCTLKAAYPGSPLPAMGWHCVSAEHFLPTECACRHFLHQVLRW